MGLVIGRRLRQHIVICIFWLTAGLAVSPSAEAADKLLRIDRGATDTVSSPNIVHRRCLTPEGNDRRLGHGQDGRLTLPETALAADFDTTIHCLVLRYNFQYETTDDPNTTGRGVMDLSRPISDSAYIEQEGHLTDPPPHDSLYFSAHMRALNRYWETVSGGKIHLTWEIYPKAQDSVYQLPNPMNHYGRCDLSELVLGLEYYFVDCFETADAVSPEIDFSQYGAFFLFHAGSDGQNDIGFPATCSDLYAGYIKYGDSVAVDDSTFYVRDALMMPETSVQDGRATAINAVMAHEFGHQLGLVDLYSTENFFTQLGDFALMDNNGFGTGIDFSSKDSHGNVIDWPVGKVFGAIPVYPCAWSRAFLGINEVVDYRHDTDGIMVAATAIADSIVAAVDSTATKIARIPITETEYYLAEVRLVEVDGEITYVRADSETSVIMGPIDITYAPTVEYDYLMPGSGMLIYHVDEEVMSLDYDGDGVINFWDNDLQWYRDERKFISLVEASGIVHFGGRYHAGYGSQEDFFRDDLKTSLTPNSNPNTFDNSGNNSHIYIDSIRRVKGGGASAQDGHYMSFNLAIDRKAEGFPVRVGYPAYGLAPIADDLNGDGTPELIAATGQVLSVVTSAGENFIRAIDPCPSCPIYYDSAVTSIHRGVDDSPAALHPVPVYALATDVITAGPVTGRHDAADAERLVAIGHLDPLLGGAVSLYEPSDSDNDAEADLWRSFPIRGIPRGLSFGDSILYGTSQYITNANPPDTVHLIYRWRFPSMSPQYDTLENSRYCYGHSRIGDALAVLSSDEPTGSDDYSVLHIVPDSGLVDTLITTYDLDDFYIWGPVTVDINMDGQPELVLFTPEGKGLLLTVDTTGTVPSFSVLNQEATNRLVSADPVIGDVDLDGRPDIIVGGVNEICAYSADFMLKTNFPREVDERFVNAAVIAPPIVADIERGGVPEIVFSSAIGNLYSYGSELSYGFPLSNGEQHWPSSSSSAVVLDDSTGSMLSYLGGDGWLYAWEVETGLSASFWPMAGAGPEGKYVFESDNLPAIAAPSLVFDDSRYYNYPNPVRGDQTQIRYYLGDDAASVELNIYDLSGREITRLHGPTLGGADNEVTWECTGVTTGVYRCVITVNMGGSTETAFTDIAIVR